MKNTDQIYFCLCLIADCSENAERCLQYFRETRNVDSLIAARRWLRGAKKNLRLANGVARREAAP